MERYLDSKHVIVHISFYVGIKSSLTNIDSQKYYFNEFYSCYLIDFSGTIENSEMGEPNKAETYEDKPTFGAANSGYYMADDSAYRAAGSHNQSSGGVYDHLPQW